MINRLVTALSQELELSAEEIADTIWLALQMSANDPPQLPLKRGKLDDAIQLPLTGELDDAPQPPFQREELDKPSLNTATTQQSSQEQKARIYPRKEEETGAKNSGLSIRVPDASSLREPLMLARALKPLMRRVASGGELVLDEVATVETTQIINNKLLFFPVFKPRLDPWLELDLVVDESISMQIWRHTIHELERLLKNYGIFRDVRVWGLINDENQPVKIRRGIGAAGKDQSLRSPKELIDPTGRRLVLVVSDCVSSLWRSGKVTPVLEMWAKQGLMAIIQMLPKWMWKRTALGWATEVWLRGLSPGVFNQNLIAQEVYLSWDEMDEERVVKVPVFTLERDRAEIWAQMLAGKGSIWASGYLFRSDRPQLSFKREEVEEIPLLKGDLGGSNGESDPPQPPLKRGELAENRVQGFRVTASPMARKLAGLLAAAPVITLPIVRLIQETFLKDSLQVNVAEVFLGGLLKPLSEIKAETNPDRVQYGFMDGVRELLLDSVPSDYVLNVIDEVSKYVAKKLGLSVADFAAVLKQEQSAKDSETAEEIGYFATVTAQVLRRLGGQYAKFAEELARPIKQPLNFLWQQGDTKIYSFCTEQPWTLSFDALVISFNPRVSVLGSLARSFEFFLDKSFILQAIEKAKNETNKNTITPDEPLLVQLPNEINAQFFSLEDNHFDHFIICATIETPMPSISNAYKATKSVINMAKQQQLSRIVMPLIGTGDIGLPITKVAIAMLSALTESLNNLSSNPIKEIIFVDKNESTIEIINQVAQSLFAQKEIDYVQLLSAQGIDYTQLRYFLEAKQWKMADSVTAMLILEATGQETRGWLEVKDFEKLLSTDLKTIDKLWVKYSHGRFGFSVQTKIWQNLGCNHTKNLKKLQNFGKQVGVYVNGSWLLREELNYTINAPIGHLPALGAWIGGIEQNCVKVLGFAFEGCGYVWTVSAISQKLSIVLQTEDISKSNKNNEVSESSLLTNVNKLLINQFNDQNSPRDNINDNNSIVFFGDRGAGKTTFLAALAHCSEIHYDVPFSVMPGNQNTEYLFDMVENILMQGLSLAPTNGMKESPVYWFHIALKPSLLVQPMAALQRKNIEINIGCMDYAGELFHNLKGNQSHLQENTGFIDDCATTSQLFFLIDGNSRDDIGYRKALIRLSDEIANRLDDRNKLKQYRIAVVISKCEQPSLWNYRHQAQKLMSLKFPQTQNAFERWSKSWDCKIAYFACSSFGVMGNPPTPNCQVIHSYVSGISGVIKSPLFWKPFGLLAPLYWLHTGKIDPRLQE